MSQWYLCVESRTREHRIPIGDEEAGAVEALKAAKDKMRFQDTVVIADRLALDARTILSIWIEESAG